MTGRVTGVIWVEPSGNPQSRPRLLAILLGRFCFGGGAPIVADACGLAVLESSPPAPLPPADADELDAADEPLDGDPPAFPAAAGFEFAW